MAATTWAGMRPISRPFTPTTSTSSGSGGVPGNDAIRNRKLAIKEKIPPDHFVKGLGFQHNVDLGQLEAMYTEEASKAMEAWLKMGDTTSPPRLPASQPAFPAVCKTLQVV